MSERLNFKDFALYHLRHTFACAPQEGLLEFFYFYCLWRGYVGPGARRQKRLFKSWRQQLNTLHGSGELERGTTAYCPPSSTVESRLAFRSRAEWSSDTESQYVDEYVYRVPERERSPAPEPIVFALANGKYVEHECMVEIFRSQLGDEFSTKEVDWHECSQPFWRADEVPLPFALVSQHQRDFVADTLTMWRIKKRAERMLSPVWLPHSLDAHLPRHLTLPPGTEHPFDHWAGPFRAACSEVADLRRVLPHFYLTTRQRQATVCAVDGLWSPEQSVRFRELCLGLGVGYLMVAGNESIRGGEGEEERENRHLTARDMWDQVRGGGYA